MCRTVILVLADPAGTILGALPPYEVPAPWWQEMADVVAGARERFGVDAMVLRLLAAERSAPPGGAVTYLAEVAQWPPPGPAPAPELAPFEVDGVRQPLRASWARTGGPARSLSWAQGTLSGAGWGVARTEQRRTWNLSSIWRLSDGDRVAWLKQVPPFLAHEGAVLRWLGTVAAGGAPTLLAAGPDGRLLLDDVPGEDRYGAPPAERDRYADLLHRIQLAAVAAADDLVRDGVPDRRGPRLAGEIAAALRRFRSVVPAVEEFDDLLDGLPERMAAAAACGVPDTLVHGDAHPGNVRSTGPDGDPVFIDWGDAFVGHPAFDILRLVEDLAGAEDPDDKNPEAVTELITAWSQRWRAAVPGCDPERALELLRPVAALRSAATYANFVARVEPIERRYHADDVPARLGCAARLLRA